MADRVRVPGVPFPLVPSSADLWRVDEATLTVSAPPHTDIFVDPAGGNAAVNAESMLNAATLLGAVPDGDFQLSARVTVAFASTFDAGHSFARAECGAASASAMQPSSARAITPLVRVAEPRAEHELDDALDAGRNAERVDRRLPIELGTRRAQPGSNTLLVAAIHIAHDADHHREWLEALLESRRGRRFLHGIQ